MQHDVLVESDQSVELLASVGFGRNLEEEGCRQLGVAGQKSVVDLDLLVDALVAGDVLGAAHLFDLKDQRVAILEDQGNAVANRDAAVALELDDALAQVVAEAGVERRALDVTSSNESHGYGPLKKDDSRRTWSRRVCAAD
jgi:hypothetical protein